MPLSSANIDRGYKRALSVKLGELVLSYWWEHGTTDAEQEVHDHFKKTRRTAPLITGTAQESYSHYNTLQPTN